MDAEHIFREADRQSNLGNYKTAYALLLQAEAQGFWRAQNSIGYFLDHGLGVKKDKRAALFWYKKAARNGDICGIANLGLHYRDQGDEMRAKFWLKRAADAGDGDSFFELAKIYAKKLNKKYNRRKAIEYLKLAMDSDSITDSSREHSLKMLKKLETQRTSQR